MSTAHDPAAPPPPRSAVMTWLGLAVIALAVFVIMLFKPGRQAPDPTAALTHPAVGAEWPDFVVEPLVGAKRPLTKADLRGKMALLNLWGPWCGPCVAELPELAQFAADRQGDDFVFVAVAYGQGKDYGLERLQGESAARIKRLPVPMAAYHDPQNTFRQAAANVGAFRGAVPVTILLDRESKVVAVWEGAVGRKGLERVVGSQKRGPGVALRSPPG